MSCVPTFDSIFVQCKASDENAFSEYRGARAENVPHDGVNRLIHRHGEIINDRPRAIRVAAADAAF